MLDERYLRLQEMSAAIAAACDTVRAGHDAARRDLMESVTGWARWRASSR
jgi:hypothetical protein